MDNIKLISELSRIKSLINDDKFNAVNGLDKIISDLSVEELLNKCENRKKREATKAALRILKVGNAREWLGKTVIAQDLRQVMCNGYLLIALNKEHYLRLPELEEAEHKRMLTDTYNEVMRYFGEAEREWNRIKLPSTSEVKIFIASHKEGNKRLKYLPYELSKNYYVNAYFLKDMLEILPEGEAFIPHNNHAGMYVKAETGIGVLLPCRP